jgi:hypothetical protein
VAACARTSLRFAPCLWNEYGSGEINEMIMLAIFQIGAVVIAGNQLYLRR